MSLEVSKPSDKGFTDAYFGDVEGPSKGQQVFPVTLSVVIPTFNEMHRLPDTLREIIPYLEKHFKDFEIIVVDDLSPDGTSQYVKDLKNPKIRVIDQPHRIGKGASVRTGCLKAEGDYILYMDADHATPIRELSHLIPIGLQRPDIVVAGVRTYQEDEGKWRRVLGLVAQLILHLILFQKAVVDSQCGFKLFPKKIAQRFFSLSKTNGGMVDAEIIFLMHKYNVPIFFQSVLWKNKAGSRINVLACMVRDPLELCRIRARNFMGAYSEKKTSPFLEETVNKSKV